MENMGAVHMHVDAVLLLRVDIARNVIPVSAQNLDPGEDLTIHLLSPDEVLELLLNGKIVQALMAAPLWKYFYEMRQGKCNIQ